MINGNKILTIIPARGDSKGLKRKNILPLLDKPLVAYPILTALNSKYIDKVILSSDDDEIISIAKSFGCEAPFKRPKELATDSAGSIDVILHAIKFLEQDGMFFDYILLLEPTSPLTETVDIDEAIKLLVSKDKLADAVIGVCKVEANHPSFLAKINNSGLLIPYDRESFSSPIRRQELEELYFFEGSLYLSKISKIKSARSFVHERTLPYVVPKWKSLEIDEYSDLLIAEIFYNNYIKNKSKEKK